MELNWDSGAVEEIHSLRGTRPLMQPSISRIEMEDLCSYRQKRKLAYAEQCRW